MENVTNVVEETMVTETPSNGLGGIVLGVATGLVLTGIGFLVKKVITSNKKDDQVIEDISDEEVVEIENETESL